MSKKDKPTAVRALECLEEVALEKGLDGLSMRDVARRLGISLAALQYHYPTKNQLIDAFVAAVVEDYRASVQELLESHGEGPRLELLVRATLEAGPTSPGERLLAMIEARAQHDEATARTMGQATQSYVGMVRDVIDAEYTALPPGASIVAATLVVSMLEGVALTMEAAVALGASPDALEQAIVDAVLSVPARLLEERQG